jgi:ribokinase
VPRVSVIGSANLDFTMALPRLPRAGETVLGGTLKVDTGGKGANQAVAARLLGVDVRMIGCVGEDAAGVQVREGLARRGVDAAALMGVPGAATGAALILVDAGGRNQIGVASGANHRLTVEMARAHEDSIAWAQVVVCQLETPLPVVRWALETARRHGVRTVLNPAPVEPLADGLLGLADVLTPNEIEAGTLAGMEVSDVDSAREAGARLRARGADCVVITLGEQGALVCDGAATVHYPAFPVSVVDTTAAGDAFTGALAAGLAAGGSLEQAIPLAAAAAALTCTRHGAQDTLPDRGAVERFLRSLRNR